MLSPLGFVARENSVLSVLLAQGLGSVLGQEVYLVVFIQIPLRFFSFC